MLRGWLDNGIKPTLISVNISRAHIDDADFCEKLLALHDKYRIPTDMIELELTETMFVQSHEQMINFIEKLHKLGFVISIDDFGSGYSALNLLKDMAVDIIKLDKSLFCEDENEKEKLLLKGIVDIARNMKLETICEGVETMEQAEYLERINCDCAQGFLFHRPIPQVEFEKKYIDIWQTEPVSSAVC